MTCCTYCGDLEKQLAAANVRVAELEAELTHQLQYKLEMIALAGQVGDKTYRLRTAAQKVLPYICTDKECMGEDESTNASEAYDELVRSLGQ